MSFDKCLLQNQCSVRFVSVWENPNTIQLKAKTYIVNYMQTLLVIDKLVEL